MRFVFGKQDMMTQARAEGHCWLLTNGLGGYGSTSAAFSVTRCDQGVLVAARTAPNDRVNLVHRLSEQLQMGEKQVYLSTQTFADGSPAEDGYRHLSSFVLDPLPCWTYEVSGIRVRRQIALAQGSNTAAVVYTVENHSQSACTLQVTPVLHCNPKDCAVDTPRPIHWKGNRVSSNGLSVTLKTNGQLGKMKPRWESLAYPDDARDGRTARGMAAACCVITKTVEAGQCAVLELICSVEPCRKSAAAICREEIRRLERLEKRSGFRDPVARQLAISANTFVAHRESTDGKTILAGYPLFGDWGRDTMIAFPGCVLATGQYETARSILRTFLAYERDGLVPNLFPEGKSDPMYNTVDAALLLINCIWLYYEKTGDADFVREAWPVMKRIASAYQTGTHHGIHMDEDGLICAGEGMDQVTWMDVCVDGILPTPRHGKPVEINAYWYNALRILERLAELNGESGVAYGGLAERVKTSFCSQFWMEDRGYLKDVLSGTAADMQLRCNQIWAVTMPFTMLPPEQERAVTETVYRHLYTPCGLRSLSPEDPEFHPTYGGPQKERDMAYHQGTVWVFPLGAFYLAWRKTHPEEGAVQVREMLEPLEATLREGCVGQLPEIYDGLTPGRSHGCFAQAWSVGELLRVYEALEKEN